VKTKALLFAPVFTLLMLSITVMSASAKIVQVDMCAWPAGAPKVGKVIFGNPMSKSDESAVDWMVTVVLQNGQPEHVYLVYLESNYKQTGWKYISLGLLTADAFGCGAFHYNGEFDIGVTATWGINEPDTYILGICLNDVTGIVPADPVGITWNVGTSVYTTYGDGGCLRSAIVLK